MQGCPNTQGLYNPRHEHDSCGVALIANINGEPSNEIVKTSLEVLVNLKHRGATNAEVNSGDGAGILLQIPHRFLASQIEGLPEPGAYATGMAFLPSAETQAERAKEAIEVLANQENLKILSWRTVPTDPSPLGKQAAEVMPSIQQVFISSEKGQTGIELERSVYLLRKKIEHRLSATLGERVYFPSLSSRVLVYKGMLTPSQLQQFYPDLSTPSLETALALVHSRFSTNTFPSWPLSHPYRYIAHNGEINTVVGNRNRMLARQANLAAPHWAEQIEQLFPICTPNSSDTASFDEALELLNLGGYPIEQAVLMMVPPAWESDNEMPQAHRDFFDFYASDMEPWDGPAVITFTDGTVVGAKLDRNGLRPGRYWVTDDDLVVMASEVGVIDIAPNKVVAKGRLEPGKMFLVDTAKGAIVDDQQIMDDLAAQHPYGDWLQNRVLLDRRTIENGTLDDGHLGATTPTELLTEQITNGYSEESLELLIEPMALSGKENIGSMGTDTPLAVLSQRPRVLFDYFSQLFAQVTNPPLDAIREELVTSHRVLLGPTDNLLKPNPQWCKQILIDSPIIGTKELAALKNCAELGFSSNRLNGHYPVTEGASGLKQALDDLCQQAEQAIGQGANIVILSNRGINAEHAPIPSLLLTGALHHHLLEKDLRTQTALILEAADSTEIHHLALLIACGANAVCPSLILETLIERLDPSLIDPTTATENYLKAATAGLIKVMSKMGVSTVASYMGAQIFEAVGLDRQLVDKYFNGISSQLGGIGLEQIAAECAARHQKAWPKRPEQLAHRNLDQGGEYRWRREGEYHLFNPETVFKLQHATRSGRYEIFKQYSQAVDDQAVRLATIRGLLELKPAAEPVPIEKVEPVEEILKRFASGAMSYGSISAEAHETLAIAMNRIGAKSNTGEGGEDPERFEPLPNGDSKRSAIKQVASGRFGVTAQYLTQASDIQIKMAQGAKPGEGGQLPGGKVWPWIAQTRHSTPGVGLISPPPHHDIYSIEDLAQLIHDLKNANPEALIHVKLVSETGVGTVAAGVSKAKADVILISGHDGGTGASPLTSLKHAGTPWELGLAETQQTLLLNNLRDRVILQADGQIKTGRDVIVAALLGAEEFGFATAPLVVSGCVMMRVCHLDTCPVGIATQDPQLRERFSGKPEFIETFFQFIAQEVREHLAALGFTSLDQAIGRTDCLAAANRTNDPKAASLDLTPLLQIPPLEPGESLHSKIAQDHGLDQALDNLLIKDTTAALQHGQPVELNYSISNQNRTVGTMLGHELVKRYPEGLPEDTITIDFVGSAGQSFGAFTPKGITLRLEGDCNDYLGKGLSGAKLIVRAPNDAGFEPTESVIAGNVILYGATSGQAFIGGLVGERFCVRNSGAEAVVEGIGDHGCEYMTGGLAVIIGPTGQNFGAGMSGGIAYVLDEEKTFKSKVNTQMVSFEELDDSDKQNLWRLLNAHFENTNSGLAQRLLEQWELTLADFVKVMPDDHRRVLNAERQAMQTGADPITAIMEASHG